MSVVVLGPAVLDRFYRVTHLPGAGESVLVTARRLDAGGKGLNQAVAAARAGAHTRLCTAIAGDRAGRFLARVIAREGLDSPLVSRRAGRSDESVIWVDPAGRHAIASHVAPGGWIPTDLEARLAASLHAGDRLLVAGFLEAARLVPLAARLAARGVRLQLNLAPFPCDYGALWPHLALVVANAEEMRLHTGRPPDEAARMLRARGVGAVVVTRGPDGASWYGAGETIHAPAPPVPVVDTTAAGDVLAGVLAAALDRGLAPEVALDRAVRAASLAVTRLGSWRAIPARRQLALG